VQIENALIGEYHKAAPDIRLRRDPRASESEQWVAALEAFSTVSDFTGTDFAHHDLRKGEYDGSGQLRSWPYGFLPRELITRSITKRRMAGVLYRADGKKKNEVRRERADVLRQFELSKEGNGRLQEDGIHGKKLEST